MDKNQLDERIVEVTKTLMSYCRVRTSNQFEAEDLAQDIIVEIYKSAANIRDDKAFYGFMWAVAGNVYKNWCKKQGLNRQCELDENIMADEMEEEDMEEVNLLRRELSLLSEKYRKATILYYIEQKSCLEISDILSISESMVKYLLFKSRQILKEGMNMVRNYGEQSYNPKGLRILFWGNGSNNYYHLCDSKISQNILYACYNDKLTAEQISLEIGVALPYMEDYLNELYEYEVLKKDGNRYYTNIPIFTRDFSIEVKSKTTKLGENIAKIIKKTIEDKESEIRKIGFAGWNMENNSFKWQIISMLLHKAIIEKLQYRAIVEYPKDKFGVECFVWGEERYDETKWETCGVGISGVANEIEDYVRFMDFVINGEMVHPYYFNKKSVTNIFLDIAKGKTTHFSENDKAIVADMVRKGYVTSIEGTLAVNAPVFTREQYVKLMKMLDEPANLIADETEKMIEAVANILKNHIPAHLKKIVKELSYLRMFTDAVVAPVGYLIESKYLIPYSGGEMLPTTHVVLDSVE